MVEGRQKRVKDPPWKIEPHMKRFTQAEQRMVVGAARRGLLDKTGLESSSQNNEYRTVHTDSYGPSNSDVIMKERYAPKFVFV